jgi:hypothetical protein
MRHAVSTAVIAFAPDSDLRPIAEESYFHFNINIVFYFIKWVTFLFA